MELLEKASPADDDIIELTDIIEQGTAASSVKANAEAVMESQMDNLFSKGNKEDQHLVPDDMSADIDSLLMDMEAGTVGVESPEARANAQNTAPKDASHNSSSPALNPDETLDMPNMSEVDALLEGLEIPPQPTGSSTAPASEALSDDIDNMLGDLLDGSTKTAPKAAPSMGPDDLDALLAEAAAEIDAKPAAPKASPKATASSDLGLDDLDALLEDNAPQTAPAANKAAAQAPAPDDAIPDDFEALLAGATAEMDAKPAAPKAAPKAAASTDLGLDDLDALLTDNAPQTAPAANKAAAQAPAPDDATPDDFEALLADAAAEIDAKPAAPKAAPKAAASTDLGLDDLDALLEDNAPQTAPAANKAAAQAPAPDDATSDDFEALLADAAAEMDAKPAAPKAAPKAAASTDLGLDDLDALLEDNTPQTAPTANKTPDQAALDADIDALLDGPATSAAPAMAEESAAQEDPKSELSFDDELESLLAAAAAPNPKGKGGARSAADVPSLEEDLDALFATVSPKSAAATAAETAPTQTEAEQAEAEQAEAEDDIPVDLSDLDDSSSFDAPEAEELADILAPTKKAKTAKAADDLLAGLDVNEPEPAPSSPAPTETDLAENTTDNAQQTFEEISSLMADVTDPQDPLTAAPTVDISMVSMSDMSDMPDMPTPPKDEEDLPELDALDALLNAANSSAPDADNLPDLELAQNIDLPDADESTEFTDEEIAQVAQELYDEKIMAEATTGEVDTNAWLNSLDEVLQDTEESPASPNLSGTDLDSLAHDTDDDKGLEALAAATLAAESLDIDALGAPLVDGSAPAPAPTAAPTAAPMSTAHHPESIDQLLAHLPEEPESTHYIYRPSTSLESLGSSLAGNSRLNEQSSAGPNQQFEKAYEQELARLQHITDRFAQSLAAADMHIAALTNTTTNAVPPIRALDDMLRQDSPFSTTLHTLVRNAVASEIKTGTSPAHSATDNSAAAHTLAPTEANSLPEDMNMLQQRLDGLSAQMQDLQDRITALEDGNKEARLQTVETRVDGQVKTIIHLEEQCKILEARLEAQAKSQSILENRFQHEVEKAAAAAAAKIIREEIAGILAGQ